MSGSNSTLADVAREAGVSLQTVSLVLNDNPKARIPQITKDKVLAAAERVHYRPNRIAQAMRQGRTNVIAVWMTLDRPNMAYLRMLKVIHEHARRDGFDLMIVGLDDSMAYSGQGKRPQLWPADGVIALDSGKAILAFRAEKSNDSTPVAVLGLEQYINSDSTSYANAAGTHLATQRLIQSGCRKIGFVGVDWILRDYPREQRARGVREAAEGSGLKAAMIPSSDETSTAAEQAVKAFLDEGNPLDGLVGFNDTVAIGAARALMQRGRRIPEDVQVVGYSDFPEANDFQIPLTTLRVPIEEVIGTAWRNLMLRIEQPDLPSQLIELPLELIERDSTRF